MPVPAFTKPAAPLTVPNVSSVLSPAGFTVMVPVCCRATLLIVWLFVKLAAAKSNVWPVRFVVPVIIALSWTVVALTNDRMYVPAGRLALATAWPTTSPAVLVTVSWYWPALIDRFVWLEAAALARPVSMKPPPSRTSCEAGL